MFTPSKYQQGFFDWVQRGRGSAVVVAVAGSGKSTTIREALPLIPEGKSVQIFAFNTTIAREMKEGVERAAKAAGRPMRGVRASTFHSVGFGAVCKFLNKRPADVQTDGGKCRKLLREFVGEEELELYSSFVTRLVGLAKGQGVGVLVADTEDRWREIIDHHDLYLEAQDATEERAIQLARQLLNRSNQAARDRAYLDFDDQLYLPLLWRLRLWQNDWVFIDEAQDTNPVRRAIAKLALRPGGRLVAVGDARQAIYGFTGASHDAIDLIKREFNAIELPLTVSYRCPKAVGELAKTLVPYFEVHEGAPVGNVETVHLGAGLERLDPHDVVLCRNTAPLVGLAYHLIGKGRGCVILGKEIGEGLANLVKNLKGKGLEGTLEKLDQFQEREVAKFTAKGEEQKAEAVGDRCAAIRTVAEHLHENERTVPALLRKIEGLFSDHNGVLTLCTVHKAKGKEWPRVAILEPSLMPSKWARQDWQAKQEENLMYVAYTRAQAELLFLEGSLQDLRKERPATPKLETQPEEIEQ